MELAKTGKAVYWLNSQIHPSERTAIETQVQMAYELATAKNPGRLRCSTT